MTRSTPERFAEEEFEAPESTTEAYNFGKVSAFYGHRRLNFEQFFRHDKWPRPHGRTGTYRAYRYGFDEGKRQRRAHLDKLGVEHG